MSRAPRTRQILADLPRLALFAALAAFLTWPLARQLRTHIPGDHFGDNALFLWNVWLAREALASPAGDLFRTDAAFYPAGVDLVLHSYALLNSVAGATVFGALPLGAAMNVTILLTFVLNAFFAYVLARRVSGDRTAATLAGAFFAACPLFTLHLHGHFNYYSAWPLALFAAAFLRARERPTTVSASLAGVSLAVVAYVDYYYFVYAVAFAALACTIRALGLDLVPRVLRRTRLDAALLVVAACGIVIAVAIAISGGFVWQIGPVRVSLRSGVNVRAVVTGALLWWLWRRRTVTPARNGAVESAAGESAAASAPRVESARSDLGWRPGRWRPEWRLLAIMSLVAALLMTPILRRAYVLWRDGQYVTQPFAWRSSPGGVDAGGLLAGNRFSTLFGDAVQWVYAMLGIDIRNDPAWLGLVPLFLVLTRRRWWPDRHAREWVLVTGVFFVWALGPYLTVFGVATGLPLPQLLFRYVPILSNARIPAHAYVMVALGVAVLLACALARFEGHRRRLAMGVLAAVLLVDFTSIPVPTIPLEPSAAYAHLASLPRGGVLDLPLGIRDGFGEEGRFVPRALYFQTVHRQPLVSGYVARLPPAVRQRYEDSPGMQTLLRLSAGEAPGAIDVDAAAIARELRDVWKVRYVVVSDDFSPPALRRLVDAMPVRLLEDEGTRRLYALE